MPREGAGVEIPGEGPGRKVAGRGEVAMPSGQDDARQPLGELRWMVDADRHHLRRKLIRMRQHVSDGNGRGDGADRLRRQG